MARIDTHAHLIPPRYRDALRKAGIDEALDKQTLDAVTKLPHVKQAKALAF